MISLDSECGGVPNDLWDSYPDEDRLFPFVGENLVRIGSSNPHWKGGISSIRKADDIIDLGEEVIEEVKRRILIGIKIDEVTGCWNWQKRKFIRGYGRLLIGKNGVTVHTAAFVAFNGRKANGFLVCHSCDNPLCGNPKHLWLGTNSDNLKDMVSKGRQPNQTGSNNYAAKLTDEQVKEIKSRLKRGQRQNRLAREYRVCKQTINNIHSGKCWSHL